MIMILSATFHYSEHKMAFKKAGQDVRVILDKLKHGLGQINCLFLQTTMSLEPVGQRICSTSSFPSKLYLLRPPPILPCRHVENLHPKQILSHEFLCFGTQKSQSPLFGTKQFPSMFLHPLPWRNTEKTISCTFKFLLPNPLPGTRKWKHYYIPLDARWQRTLLFWNDIGSWSLSGPFGGCFFYSLICWMSTHERGSSFSPFCVCCSLGSSSTRMPDLWLIESSSWFFSQFVDFATRSIGMDLNRGHSLV